MSNFVSFTVPIAEVALAEKLHTQSPTHPAYLMLRDLKLALCNMSKSMLIRHGWNIYWVVDGLFVVPCQISGSVSMSVCLY